MENLKKIRYMQATNNSIIYYSDKGDKASKVSFNADNSIRTSLLVSARPTLPSYFVKNNLFSKSNAWIKGLIIDLILILLSLLSHNSYVFYAVFCFVILVSFKFFKLIYIIYHMKVTKNFESMARMVAASHMATNAYKDLQRIPTLEEAKRYSFYSSYSLVNSLFANILSHFAFIIITTLLPNLSFVNFFIYACLLPAFVFALFSQVGVLNFLQALVTTTPTDNELNAAIEGIKFYEDVETGVKVMYMEE